MADKTTQPEVVSDITMEQALAARVFHYNTPRPKDGSCFVWRRNGQTQTWKTRPTHFRIPVKYGLYEYGYIDQDNIRSFHLPQESCK